MTNKPSLVNAIYNYLQNDRYSIDYSSCGTFSKDDQAVADMIELSDITKDQIAAIVADEYRDRLECLKDVTIEGMTKAISISLCGEWIAGRNEITIGYNHSNRFHEGLRVGESTLFFIV